MSLTISETLAREAAEWTFEQLPSNVVHEAKRRILDTLACGMGGARSRPSAVLQTAMRGPLSGPVESTVWGSDLRTSCMNAALVNGVMVRFTEAIDRAHEGAEGLTTMGHPCEIIPSILAVAEREHRSGKDVIAAVVLGYELQDRFMYATGGSRIMSSRGWKHEVRAGLLVPLVIGPMLGMTKAQVVNAVGIAGCYVGAFDLLDQGTEQLTMSRNMRFPLNAYKAILATFMAQRGFEGPARVYEGHNGFVEVILGGELDVAKLTKPRTTYTILDVSTKAYPVNGRLQPQTEALIRLVTEHDLAPEQIARIRITTSPRVVAGMGSAETRRYPKTKESADTSAYYAAALAVVDREIRFSLDQFEPERLEDPRLRAVIDKIDLVPFAEWGELQAPADVEITTADGSIFRRRVDHPRGHVLNPMTDSEIQAKFRGMAAGSLPRARMDEVITTVDGLEETPDVGALLGLLAA